MEPIPLEPAQRGAPLPLKRSLPPQRSHEPIAIVGIGCRFPGGGHDPRSFWRMLLDRTDAVTEIPPDRWNIERFYHPSPGAPGRTYAKWGAFLESLDEFEPECFGISPREAAYMDPQQRLLLEVAWEALLDGGVQPESLAGTRTAVYVGISTSDYSQIQHSPFHLTAVNPYSATGGAFSIAANRISYCLNLLGPSVSVDTACSSALVATHLACQSIWRNEADSALVGGVAVNITPFNFIAFSAATMLAADGRCKAFDASANGFVRGEGAGLVYLKPLARALEDQDRVYAVIRATAVNQDGRTGGIAAPSQSSQELLLREACAGAGIAPADIDYVEAHGTGTSLGDPIEARALGSVLSEGRPGERPCWIGSVKTNIGHLEAAAGSAGLIKAALAIHHGEIPASLHFNEPNPEIPFEELQLRVPTEMTPFAAGRRLTGVNSFGFGGTNANAILEIAPTAPAVSAPPAGPSLLVLSARTQDGLEQLAGSARHALAQCPDDAAHLANVVYNFAVRRTTYPHRLAAAGSDRDSLLEQLDAFIAGERRTGLSKGLASAIPHKVAFVCSGQGTQWWGMGRGLLAAEPRFRAVVERCHEELSRYASWSLLDEFARDERDTQFDRAQYAQPALFALQVGLAAVWRDRGVEPAGLVGHSVGEVAAAHLAGALSFEDAVRVIYERGRTMDFDGALGSMLAVGCTEGEAVEALKGREEQASLAAINGPNSVTLSGQREALEPIASRFEAEGRFVRFLNVRYAFHSPQMDPVQDELHSVLAGVRPREASIPLMSTVTGSRAQGVELDAAYWWRNVREAVRFSEGVRGLIEEGCTTFIELGPHPALSGNVLECLSEAKVTGIAVPSLRREEDESIHLLGALGVLHNAGFPVEWDRLWPEPRAVVDLPTYPWQRQSYWTESQHLSESRVNAPPHPFLERRIDAAAETYEFSLDLRLFRYLADHRVRGTTIFPAAAYLENLIGLARARWGDVPCRCEGIQFQRAIFVSDPEQPVQVQLETGPGGALSISSRGQIDEPWNLNLAGYLHNNFHVDPPEPLDVDEAKRDLHPLEADRLYAEFARYGLDYGPAFRTIQEAWVGNGEALARIALREEESAELDRYHLHPALLDGCFQSLSPALGGIDPRLFLPVRLERLDVYASPGASVWARARITELADTYLVADFEIFDLTGQPVARIAGFRCRAMEGKRPETRTGVHECRYEMIWRQRPLMLEDVEPKASRVRASATFLPDPPTLAAQVERFIAQGGDQVFTMTPQRYGAMAELSASYGSWAFEQLVTSAGISAPWHLPQLVEAGVLARDQIGYARQLLKLAKTEGAIDGDEESGWSLVATRSAVPHDVWRAALQRFPDHAAEWALFGMIGDRLPEILAGTLDTLEVLFPDGPSETLNALYQDSPFASRTVHVAAEAVRLCLARRPPTRKLRVLEIGAGTGGFTVNILPLFPPTECEYVFTDISKAFLTEAEKRFRDYPFVDYQILDIETDPAEQELPLHGFDLVIASSVIHATRDLDVSLEHAKRMLVPGGLLMMVELPPALCLGDFVFGGTTGWWLFEDHDRRADSPLLSSPDWVRTLNEVGFEEATELDPDADPHAPNLIVLAARAPERTVELAENATKPTRDGGPWLIAVDDEATGRELAAAMAEQGWEARVALTGPGGRGSALVGGTSAEVARLAGFDESWSGIVHARLLDAPAEMSEESWKGAEEAGCLDLVALVQFLAEQGLTRTQLVVLTRGAQTTPADDLPPAIAQTPAIGLCRTIMSEYPDLGIRCVDLEGGVPREASDWVSELAFADEEEEVALRGELRYVPRHVRHRGRFATTTGDVAFRLEPSAAGTLERLAWVAMEEREPGPGEVEIRVQAAGLNFRDVMKALGLYPNDTQDYLLLGDECSGVVNRVGPGVTRCAPGDAVMALATGAFASTVITPESFVAAIPSGWSREEAATAPIAYLTAQYALHELGRLAAGETVLIQSGAGGVGYASIQIAKAAGATVIATASNRDKRAFLKRVGVDHVLDSRGLAFADHVRTLTDGRGVDLVLNSLAGEAIARGVACLAPFGRFLELGKTDIYQDHRIGLWAFRKNLSFCAIDLAAVFLEKPALVRQIFEELLEKFETGALSAIPYRAIPTPRFGDAFRLMAKRVHIGKLVARFDGPVEVRLPPAPMPAVRDDRAYVITGGLAGFGLAVAEELVRRGARHLTLIGRRGTGTPGAAEAVAALEATGASVMVEAADVTDAENLSAILERTRRDSAPLGGVFHAAMVLDDAPLVELDRERFTRVTAPKVLGAWHLDRLTREDSLDYFVMFSSASTVIGNPGQGNYVAANHFLGALAQHRQRRGLPALTIDWGMLTEIGYVARNTEVIAHLARRGIEGLKPDEALEALFDLFGDDAPHTVVARLDLGKAVALLGNREIPQRLSEMGTGGATEGDDGSTARIVEAIQQASGEERVVLLRDYLRGQLARVLGCAPDTLEFDQPLAELGLDSLMAVELMNRIETDLDRTLSAQVLMQDPTLDGIAESLLLAIGTRDSSASRPGPEDDDLFVELREGHPDQTLFCVHCSGGELAPYDELASRLPDGWGLTGIRSPASLGSSRSYASITELAEHYTSLIQRRQPRGPYRLLGFSFGGLAVRAIAQLLEARGEEIEILALVDADLQWAHPDCPVHWVMAQRLGEIFGLLARDRKELKAVHAAWVAADEEEKRALFEAQTWESGAERLIAWLADRDLLVEEVSVEAIRRIIAQHGPEHELIPTFEPVEIAAPHLLWWASTRSATERYSPWEWEQFCTSKVQNRVLPGHHYDLMTGEALGQLVEELTRALQESGVETT
jgi:acyl transferase domain-containing protein/NADPH:quinone reductase-like Zn-dependent oxidoreductase/thioesterase domain-containing protein/acyl carrier protein